MNDYSKHEAPGATSTRTAPILVVPYMWIGDFVRCHTVVRLLRARFPASPIDVLTTTMVAPLLDYMPGVRKGVVWDLPRKRLAWSQHRALAARLRQEGYGRALIMPRTWKSTLAPFLAGIPERTGFAGELRFALLNDVRWGEAPGMGAWTNAPGFLHAAPALGTPSRGIFGPTSLWHGAPPNPLAAVVETKPVGSCPPCHKPTCRYGHHRCMREIPADPVVA